MPELPEVTIITEQLNKKLKGLVLQVIETDWPKKFYWNGFSIKDLKGAKVVSVRRLGKVVIVQLSVLGSQLSDSSQSVSQLTGKQIIDKQKSENRKQRTDNRISILIHLKLTGQLIYQDKKTRIAGGHPIPPLNLPVPNKTTRVTFTFTNPSTSSGQVVGHLYFNDIRKFGWVKIVESDESKIKEAIGAELGPDPLKMKYEEFESRIKKRPQARIKKLLMDQSFISGVGNIYSDEALWRAKIHPKRFVESLADSEIKGLFEGIRDSLNLAIEKGGSSASAFVDSGGERGLYLSFAHAYHMTGRPCERCKTLIRREKIDGRSAHFCPNCQWLR